MIYVFNTTPKESKSLVDFQIAMALETENLILEEMKVCQGVKKIIENPHLGSYYIAKEKNVVIGCLLTLYEWSDWRNAYVIWIHSVYVLPDYRKKGVFKSFYMHLQNLVKEDQNFAGLRLYVEKNNIQAQKVYKKMGMNNSHYELYEWLKNS